MNYEDKTKEELIEGLAECASGLLNWKYRKSRASGEKGASLWAKKNMFYPTLKDWR